MQVSMQPLTQVLFVVVQLVLQRSSRAVQTAAEELALVLRHCVEILTQASSQTASSLLFCWDWEGEEGHAEVHMVALALHAAPQSNRTPHPLPFTNPKDVITRAEIVRMANKVKQAIRLAFRETCREHMATSIKANNGRIRD